MRWPVALCLVMGVGGCYASHEREGGGGTGSGGRCAAPEAMGDAECPSSPFNGVLPRGVCRLEDGSLLAFSDARHSLSCRGSGVDRFALHADLCVGVERSTRREVAVCESAADPSTLGVVEFLSGGRPPYLPIAYDGRGTRCALSSRLIAPNAEPWRPFVEADTLCDDPYAWCGSPLVLELRQLDGDGCAGTNYTQRCAATVVDGRIVLRAETAEAEPTGCLPARADRVARCVAPPLAAGRYDVTDERGRPLGTVEVPGEAPVGEDLPTSCVAIAAP